MCATLRGDRVPDAIEPIVAYRMWHLARPPYGPRLLSFNGEAWRPDGWMNAECRRTTQGPGSIGSVGTFGETHPAPAESCTCGIYALKEQELRLRFAPSFVRTPLILGRVKLAGKVIEHDLGYRAERARVVELSCRPEDKRRSQRPLAVEYGARVSAELLSEEPDSGLSGLDSTLGPARSTAARRGGTPAPQQAASGPVPPGGALDGSLDRCEPCRLTWPGGFHRPAHGSLGVDSGPSTMGRQIHRDHVVASMGEDSPRRRPLQGAVPFSPALTTSGSVI